MKTALELSMCIRNVLIQYENFDPKSTTMEKIREALEPQEDKSILEIIREEAGKIHIPNPDIEVLEGQARINIHMDLNKQGREIESAMFRAIRRVRVKDTQRIKELEDEIKTMEKF